MTMGESNGENSVLSPVATVEKRKRRRIPVSQSARIRPLDARFEEEVRTTLNASSDDLYFTSWAEHYVVGMVVGVTFPFTSVELRNSEYEAEVVRVDRLRDGRIGIAVRRRFLPGASDAD